MISLCWPESHIEANTVEKFFMLLLHLHMGRVLHILEFLVQICYSEVD